MYDRDDDDDETDDDILDDNMPLRALKTFLTGSIQLEVIKGNFSDNESF